MPSPFDWLEFLELAKALAKSDEEAAMRSAVSRAYYAVYGSIARVLLVEGFDASSTTDPHFQMWRHLERNPVGKPEGRTRGVLARYGRELRLFRKKADYDSEIDDLRNLVDDALERAATMRNLLPRLTE